jgi:hypothetical protein
MMAFRIRPAPPLEADPPSELAFRSIRPAVLLPQRMILANALLADAQSNRLAIWAPSGRQELGLD